MRVFATGSVVRQREQQKVQKHGPLLRHRVGLTMLEHAAAVQQLGCWAGRAVKMGVLVVVPFLPEEKVAERVGDATTKEGLRGQVGEQVVQQ